MEQVTRDRVIGLLEDKGWSREQAIGLAANFHAESALNPGAEGDGGRAYGIAQWHPDRQEEFSRVYGKSIKGSSLEEQVAFADYELRAGQEQSAGKRLGAAKDAAEAARITSVHYERPADRDGEAERRAALAVAFDKLPSLKDGRPVKSKVKPVSDALADKALSGLPYDDPAGIDASRDDAAASQRAAEKDQARKDGTHFGDVVHEALRDPRVMPTWAIMSRFTEGEGGGDPSYDYMARRDQIEKGLEEEERQYLRENAKSADSEQRALTEIQYRRGLNQTYADAGAFSTFAGQMVAGLADPASLVTGVAVGKAFQITRIGAQAGGAARVGALAAEGAAANVAIEGLADASGEVKTSSDYAMAAATGAAFVLPFARGVHRQAADAEALRLARGIQEQAASEQTAKVAKVMQDEPHLTPEQVARRVEEQETEQVTRAVSEATGPVRQDPVVPRDVMKEMEAEFTGATDKPEPVQSGRERSDTDFADTVIEPTTLERIDQLRKGEVTRQVQDTNGGTIKLSWSADGNKLPRHGSIAEALTAVHMHPLATPADKRLSSYLVKVMSADGLQVDVRFTARKGQSNFDPNGPGVAINNHGTGTAGAAGRSTLVEQMMGLTKTGLYALLHETVHVATYHRINAWEAAAGKLRPEQQRAMTQFEDLFNRFRDEVAPLRKDGKSDRSGALYAASNMHEFAAQVMTDRETRFVLSMMEGKSVAGRASNALREFLSVIRRILGLGEKHTGFDEATKLIDQMIAMPMDNVKFANGTPVFAPEGAQVNPLISRRARDTWAERMTQYAQGYLAKNPIDMARLKTLTMKIGGASDGLVLAASKNPIMQLVASLVTETTTGAAGRKANVAIRSKMLTHKFVGNTMLDYDAAYTVWRGRSGGGVMEDMFRGEKRRKFDQTVYEEVLNRRDPNYAPHADKSVVEAADALEGLFERSRLAQVDAGVLGHGSLPSSSRGYLPQALDGTKLQAASVKDLSLLHEGLAAQFEARLGWDRDFARDFAPFYTERARRRAMGDKGLEGLGGGGEGLQLVRDTLQEMQADPTLVDRVRAADSKLGQSHTKARLDIDLRQELRPGLRMMDFFSTNTLLLARSYAKRTAGTVSLTEAGIHGIRGVRELEQAALLKQDGTQPTAEEMEAFRRVMAEVLGTPVAGSVVSAGASNMGLLVGLQRLGGLIFTQAGETFNMIHHLGLRSLLAGVPDLPRIMGEVGRLKRGAPSENHILTSIEQYGGEIGTEQFKMVAPLDAPDHALGAYVDQPGLVSRLLRAGGHLQSKISGFRGLMAAQHRMVAEQIVMKAARYIRDGGDDIALRDMGFTPEVAQAMKRDLQHVAKWDAGDKLVEFDLTRVSDPRTAEAFVQAVHRGTGQIIQGTFIGERNKWFHNDYVRLLMQLRTFGLTATEKQWGRTRMNHGYAYAAGMLMGQMALVLPIHLARLQLAAAGREDRDKYLRENLHPAALVRATMNYASMSGMTADVLDLLTGVAGGWGGKDTQDLLGGRNAQQSTSIGKLVPAAGSVDSLVRAASGHSKLYNSLKQLPFSNLWYLLPAMNLTKE